MNDRLDNLISKANDDHLRFRKVGSFMNHTLIHMQKGFTLQNVIETLKVHHQSCLAVCNSKLKVIGIVTQHDLIIQAAAGVTSKSVCKFHERVFCVKETDSLKDVIVQFYKKKIKQCPVVDNEGHLIGYLSRMDILSVLIE